MILDAGRIHKKTRTADFFTNVRHMPLLSVETKVVVDFDCCRELNQAYSGTHQKQVNDAVFEKYVEKREANADKLQLFRVFAKGNGFLLDALTATITNFFLFSNLMVRLLRLSDHR